MKYYKSINNMTQSKPLSIHSELQQVLLPGSVRWKIGIDENDVKQLLEGNIFTRYQIAGGEDIPDAISCFKPEKFRRDKECRVIVTILRKEDYKLSTRESWGIGCFLKKYLQSDNICFGYGIDESLTENVVLTIAASYKYVLCN